LCRKRYDANGRVDAERIRIKNEKELKEKKKKEKAEKKAKKAEKKAEKKKKIFDAEMAAAQADKDKANVEALLKEQEQASVSGGDADHNAGAKVEL
jgi:hypothetical protein